MRDDIHRNLPLPRAWKRLVKSVAREAERPSWTECARHVVTYELSQLSPTVRSAAAECLRQPDLFGRVDSIIRERAVSPIDQDFIRELAVAPERDPQAAIQTALCRAVDSRAVAQIRAARTRVALESPRDCAPLVSRLNTALAGVETSQLVAQHLAGFQSIRRVVPTVDIEMDLRGGL